MKTVVHQCKNSGMVRLSGTIEMSVVRGCKQGKIENCTIKTGFDRQGESQQDNARERLALASPSRVSPGNPESLWLGPDHWLIVSSSLAAQNIIEECSDALTDILHSAVDYSALLCSASSHGSGCPSIIGEWHGH